MEEHVPRHSRRVQNLPPIPFEYPPPPRRRRLNTAGSFEPSGSSNLIGEPDSSETMASAPENTGIRNLEAEGFVRPFNPPLTEGDPSVVVQIPDSRVRADTSYRASQGLVQDDTAQAAEMVMTPLAGRSTPPYRSVSMPNPYVPVGTGASQVFSKPTITQSTWNTFVGPSSSGTSIFGMPSTNLFSSTPVVVNPVTPSTSFVPTSQVFSWNLGQNPPSVPVFGTTPAQNSGSASGFNPETDPQIQSSRPWPSTSSGTSAPFSLFANSGSGTTPPVASTSGSQYFQTNPS